MYIMIRICVYMYGYVYLARTMFVRVSDAPRRLRPSRAQSQY